MASRLTSQFLFTIISLSTLLFLSFPVKALATTNAANDTLPLRPWNVTRLNTGSPSGRPASFPYSGIYVTITDPNTISMGPTNFVEAFFPSSTVDCTIRWNSYFEEPYGWVTPCVGNISHGKWTVEMLKAPIPANESESWSQPSPTRNFILKFRLEDGVVLDNGRVVTKIYEGKEVFAVGKNLDFVCGGSGVCSSGLKSPTEGGDRSVAVKQKLVETRVRCFTDGDC
ncbi:hypothetical protein V8F20_006038 [Naviculisporaceae sp. PSN 640]